MGVTSSKPMLVTIIHRKRTHALVGVKGAVVPIGPEDETSPSLNSGALLIQGYNNIFVKYNHLSNINDTIKSILLELQCDNLCVTDRGVQAPILRDAKETDKQKVFVSARTIIKQSIKEHASHDINMLSGPYAIFSTVKNANT